MLSPQDLYKMTLLTWAVALSDDCCAGEFSRENSLFLPLPLFKLGLNSNFLAWVSLKPVCGNLQSHNFNSSVCCSRARALIEKTRRISENMSWVELAIFFANLAYISHIRQNRLCQFKYLPHYFIFYLINWIFAAETITGNTVDAVILEVIEAPRRRWVKNWALMSYF